MLPRSSHKHFMDAEIDTRGNPSIPCPDLLEILNRGSLPVDQRLVHAHWSTHLADNAQVDDCNRLVLDVPDGVRPPKSVSVCE